MYSVIINGKVLDFKFKRLNDFTYNFSVGDIFLGQIYHIDKSWSCVSFLASSDLCPINGFRTRFDAAEMLLKINKLGRT